MNRMTNRTDAELNFIAQDARTAASFAAEIGNAQAEAKYLDEMADALSELNRRRREHAAGRFPTA